MSLLCPLAALAAVIGLCRIAPVDRRSLYLAPVGCTVLYLCILTAAVMAVLR
ncbi:hypothetical protein ACFSUJ_12175 [Streptomyces lusitanus]|uniref:Uncharacterized protein n=1 Tax=Streptomyces lusitanus TaxID=68232 RepID=A0ABU3JP66_9ACTN|nr:hypothetical protein [Streptomyces lusitanus]